MATNPISTPSSSTIAVTPQPRTYQEMLNYLLPTKTVGMVIAAIAVHAAVGAAPQANDSPRNEPKAIVEALVGRDYRNLPRYTSGQEVFEYRPIFESYPNYFTEAKKLPDGSIDKWNATPAFGGCSQKMVVKDIKVTGVQYAQDPTTSVHRPGVNPYEVYVTVEAEVIALRLWHLDKIPKDQRCSWLGLEIKNTLTGKREAYLDNADDDKALLKMMKGFGTLRNNYIVIDPHRRQWSYGINLLLPRSGKGQERHWDKTLRRFVDAVNPRWLIQDPYPPAAVYVGAEITWVMTLLERTQAEARVSCVHAIRNGRQDLPKQLNWEHPACRGNAEIQKDLGHIRNYEAQLEVLHQIK